jgi:hypothetical protein
LESALDATPWHAGRGILEAGAIVLRSSSTYESLTLESQLFHHFNKLSPLMNGTQPPIYRHMWNAIVGIGDGL